MGIADELSAVAAERGFALYGVAAAGPVRDEGRLRSWLGAGRHADLGWMKERLEQRLDPLLLRPEARSVVALGVFYGSSGADPPPAAGSGRVARYARGRDYHNVLGKRLRKLQRWLRHKVGGAPAYTSVDTGVVLERYWAWRAGLGDRGEHGGLIVPGRGSWLLLGALVTHVELPIDQPASAVCDGCGRCRAACPAQALVAPGVVDARRCIAYLTIEKRGAWPDGLAELAGSRMFGCDSCVEACPHSGVATAGDPALAEVEGRRDLDLAMVLSLSSREELRGRLFGSPLQRAGVAGLKRNALIVLGNQRDRAAVPMVRRRLGDDPEPQVRAQAAWALGRLGGRRAAAALDAAANNEPDETTLAAIRRAQEKVT